MPLLRAYINSLSFDEVQKAKYGMTLEGFVLFLSEIPQLCEAHLGVLQCHDPAIGSTSTSLSSGQDIRESRSRTLQLDVPLHEHRDEGAQPQRAKSYMEGGFSLLFRDTEETETVNQDSKS